LNTEYFYTSIEVSLKQLNTYSANVRREEQADQRALDKAEKNAHRSISAQPSAEKQEVVKADNSENKKRSSNGGSN